MSDAPTPQITTYAMDSESPKAAWKPLNSRQRRVLGTLMEKSKTTPDGYPMSISGLTTGCNQKSNRAPIMNLSTEQVEDTVNSLRDLGAVAIVQGSGRVEKVRHYAYQWLGINKVESGVMTELLLRGEQSLGELRIRASRMEPIADLGELQRLLQELESRRLIVFLTASGRGQIVSHNLYSDNELEQLKKIVAERGAFSEDEASSAESSPQRSSTPSSASSKLSELQQEVTDLREQITEMQSRLKLLEEIIK